jgi:hypothetical protein
MWERIRSIVSDVGVRAATCRTVLLLVASLAEAFTVTPMNNTLQTRIEQLLTATPATWREQAQLHDDLDAIFYEWADEQPDRSTPWPAQIDAIVARQSALYRELAANRPWSAYSTCTGSSTIWVQAGSEVAEQVMSALDISLSAVCGDCHDQNWSEVELDWDAVPPADTRNGRHQVIDAAAVIDLVGASA